MLYENVRLLFKTPLESCPDLLGVVLASVRVRPAACSGIPSKKGRDIWP